MRYKSYREPLSERDATIYSRARTPILLCEGLVMENPFGFKIKVLFVFYSKKSRRPKIQYESIIGHTSEIKIEYISEFIKHKVFHKYSKHMKTEFNHWLVSDKR